MPNFHVIFAVPPSCSFSTFLPRSLHVCELYYFVLLLLLLYFGVCFACCKSQQPFRVFKKPVPVPRGEFPQESDAKRPRFSFFSFLAGLNQEPKKKTKKKQISKEIRNGIIAVG